MEDWNGSNSFSEKADAGSMTASSDHGVVRLDLIEFHVMPGEGRVSVGEG
jgi:hypothetical protein